MEYLELKSSIEKHGVLSPALVRPKDNSRFELVAGNCRRVASIELKLTTLPCVVKSLSDQEVLALQIHENAIRLKTQPAEFANQLKRIMDQTPGMTLATLAVLVGKQVAWVKRLLELPKLDKDTQRLVDRGTMRVKNAMMLAKIPKQWRGEQITNACEMTEKEFSPLASSIIKQYQESVRQGKLDAHFNTPFKPVAHARKPKEVQAEIDNPKVLPRLIVSEKVTTLLDAALLGTRWGHHLDREHIEQLRLKAEAQGRLESESDNDVIDD
jgi:ParB/RepB/Spo0J family partition protein